MMAMAMSAQCSQQILHYLSRCWLAVSAIKEQLRIKPKKENNKITIFHSILLKLICRCFYKYDTTTPPLVRCGRRSLIFNEKHGVREHSGASTCVVPPLPSATLAHADSNRSLVLITARHLERNKKKTNEHFHKKRGYIVFHVHVDMQLCTCANHALRRSCCFRLFRIANFQHGSLFHR